MKAAVTRPAASGPAAPRPAAKPEADLVRTERSLFCDILKIKQQRQLERLGIAFYDAHTRIQWSYNGDGVFHAASTMKLAVLIGVFRQIHQGELTLDAPVHIRNRFDSVVEGAPPFSLDLGSEQSRMVVRKLNRTLTVGQLAVEMITTSSNLATNLLIDVVSVPTIQKALDELGVRGIKVVRKVDDRAAHRAAINNMVTADGLLHLLRLITDGRIYSPEISGQVLEILLKQRYRSGIPAGLPGTAQVAHKTGNISTVHHDAGIVFIGERRPYAVVILTQFPSKVGRTHAVADLSRGIFETLVSIAKAMPAETPQEPKSA
ncbi:MAG TPA: serine hydrolase [Vicinamibacteria bacterium]|nr:serine hydrolase [Vicinamibacteria bacterium]